MHLRPIEESDRDFLLRMIIEAGFHPQAPRPSTEAARTDPRLMQWIDSFGERDGDIGVIATERDERIGAAWCRLFEASRIIGEVGYCDDRTPCVAIAVASGWRGKGIGRMLLEELLVESRRIGFESLSLSVGESNPTRRLYSRLGFQEVSRNGSTLTMRLVSDQE